MTPLAPHLSLIEESLKYTRLAFLEYRSYPDEAFRAGRIADVDAALAAVRVLKKKGL